MTPSTGWLPGRQADFRGTIRMKYAHANTAPPRSQSRAPRGRSHHEAGRAAEPGSRGVSENRARAGGAGDSVSARAEASLEVAPLGDQAGKGSGVGLAGAADCLGIRF